MGASGGQSQPGPRPATGSRPARTAAVAACLVLLVTASFIPALDIYLTGDDFEWLDAAFEIPHRLEAGFARINSMWRPLVMASFLADYLLFGARPAWFMATNIAIHLGNTTLLFALLGRLRCRPLVAAAVAGLFAVSPLHSEAVLWASSRGDTLLLTSWLAALLVLDRMRASGGDPARSALLMLLFAAAAGSKENWVVLPFLATAFLVLVREWTPTAAVRTLAGPWLLLVVYLAVVVVVPNLAGQSSPTYYAAFEPPAMVLKACRLLLTYLGFGGFASSAAAATAIAAIVSVLAVVVSIGSRPALWALLWTAAALALAAPFADAALRHNYLPLAGFWLTAGLLGERFAGRLERVESPRMRAAATAAAAAALLVLTVAQLRALRVEMADYRFYGELHRRLAADFEQVAPAVPRDRPLVLVDLGTRQAVLETADAMTGVPKTLYVRPDALWQLVRLPPLANFLGDPLRELLRPLPAGADVATVLDGERSVLLFTDAGFRLADELPEGLREAVAAAGALPDRVHLYRYERFEGP